LSIQKLFALCATVNVTCKGIQFGNIEKKDWYTIQSIQIQLHGSLSALLQFFTALAQEKLSIRCHQLHITFDHDIFYNGTLTIQSYCLKPQ
jgi:type VI protein secretion system component VasF